MFRFIKIILFIAFITVLSLLIIEKPGQVIIEWFDIELRSNIPIVIILLFLTAIILKFFIFSPLRIIKNIFSFKSAKKNLKQAKISKKEEPIKEIKPLELPKETKSIVINDNNLLLSSFIAIQANDIEELEKNYKKALEDKNLKDSSFVKLLQAFILDERGKKEEAVKLFEELLLLEDNSEMYLIASKKIIEYSILNKDIDKAFLIVKKLYELKKDVKWIADIKLDLLIKKRLWKEALAHLEEIFPKNLILEDLYKKLKSMIFFELSKEEKDAGDNEEAMKFAVSSNETDISFHAGAVLAASFYADKGLDRKAAGALSRVWRIRPVPDIAHAYVKIWKKENVFEQVQRVEQLALANNKHPLNDLMLAEYNIKAGLWGPVRKHLDNYISRYPTTKKTAKMMAEFEEGGNKDYDAAKEWLKDSETAEQDQMWICSKCYGQPGKWSSFCPYCDSFASIEWVTPGRTIEQEINFEKSGMAK